MIIVLVFNSMIFPCMQFLNIRQNPRLESRLDQTSRLLGQPARASVSACSDHGTGEWNRFRTVLHVTWAIAKSKTTLDHVLHWASLTLLVELPSPRLVCITRWPTYPILTQSGIDGKIETRTPLLPENARSMSNDQSTSSVSVSHESWMICENQKFNLSDEKI